MILEPILFKNLMILAIFNLTSPFKPVPRIPSMINSGIFFLKISIFEIIGILRVYVIFVKELKFESLRLIKKIETLNFSFLIILPQLRSLTHYYQFLKTLKCLDYDNFSISIHSIPNFLPTFLIRSNSEIL